MTADRLPLLCRLLGHAWHQPEGVFTPMLCRRCGADRWHLKMKEQGHQ